MAIASKGMRFKVLDRETNVPTIDFRAVKTSDAYNNFMDSANKAAASIKESDKLVKGVKNSINDLNKMINNASDKAMSAIKGALDQAMNFIENIKLPNVVKDIFNSIKELNLDGVKGFLKDLLHVGSTLLCNNLDLLKLTMLGYAINKNIIAGLLVGLLLKWLDQYCKGFNKKEFDKKSGLQKVDSMFPQKGITVDPGSAFKDFTKQYGNFLAATKPLTVGVAIPKLDAVNAIKSGDVRGVVNNLRSAELTTAMKKDYTATITSQLAGLSPTSSEYKNLLQAKAEISSLPMVTAERREVTNKYSNMSDELGSFIKNTKGVDLDQMNTFEMTETELALSSKIKEMQALASTNKDLMTRSDSIGANKGFDFSSVLPPLSDAEKTLVTSTGGSGTAHRTLDMHPTSTLFA